jgi:uncharacterized protein YndB with AHSA1/START domain
MMAEMQSRRTDGAERMIAASGQQLFGAFIDASALMEWLPPDGMRGKAHEYEFREGGSYRIELDSKDSDHAPGKRSADGDVSKGRFVEIVPERKIRQTVVFDSKDADFSGEMTMTWKFEDAPGGTLVTVTADDATWFCRKVRCRTRNGGSRLLSMPRGSRTARPGMDTD